MNITADQVRQKIHAHRTGNPTYDAEIAATYWDAYARQARAELGDEEIDRRVKALHERGDRVLAEHRDYVRECKAARERREPLPPHPHHNPDAWRRWKYTQEWQRTLGLN
jgi:hypothetical protein